VENVADDMFDEWEEASSRNATSKQARTRDIEQVRDEFDRLRANLLEVDSRLSTLLESLEEQIAVLEQRPAPAPKDLNGVAAGIDASLREVETYIQRSNDQIDRLVGTLRD
jgi:chromosome segregation ATPase